MFVMNHKRVRQTLGLCLLAGTMLTLSAPTAHAGFNWTPPPPPPPKETAATPDMAAAPLTPVEGEKMPAPVAAAPAPAPVAMEAPAPAPTPAPAAMPAPAAPAPMTAPEYAEIKGFGSDIPLTMALHQIVPAGYSWSFAPGIDSGTSVSWQGGRPWNVVLNDSLQSSGLTAVIDNHSVRIERAGGSTAGDQMRAAMAAEGAWMGPIEQRYTPEQLAAIGANSKGYHPSYPRHTPHKVDGDHKSSAPQSGDQANAMPTASSPASVTVGASTAQAGPTSLTDHMQQDNMPAAGVPTPPPPAALDVNAVSHWKADKGQSLHDILKAWCDRSNVDLVWEAHKDYKINQKVSMKGTFPEAVMKLLTSYNDVKPRPVGQLHPNLPNGPSILIIQNPPGA